ncbi:hypothetical protein NPIL_676601 [Nephila pilipes]|uniref:Uncharacterized protein n=1 Tax=Nephila pilipes TaxID=299642 RepID=A0A8X6PNJ6_NEPPI|nr:hypothetical protein NPIL_676601 [Nephila pilipes]
MQSFINSSSDESLSYGGYGVHDDHGITRDSYQQRTADPGAIVSNLTGELITISETFSPHLSQINQNTPHSLEISCDPRAAIAAVQNDGN